MSIPIIASARVPTLMMSRLALSNVNRTNLALMRAQDQLATGRIISRPSDDPIRAAGIAAIDSRIEHGEQRLRNLNHADAALTALDAALGDAGTLLLDAKTIAATQVNLGASDDEREGQAVIIDSMLRTLYSIVNRTSVAGHIFGGSSPGSAPVRDFLGGFRYVSGGPGLITDLDLGDRVPITLGAGSTLGEVSARVRSSVDLDPALTPETRLEDLGGGRGLGVTLGRVEFSAGGMPRASIDLAGSQSVADVLGRLDAAIRAYEAEHGITVLGAGGVGVSGGAISVDIDPGTAGMTLEFHEIGEGVTARDLGLSGEGHPGFSALNASGVDLAPMLTWLTPIASLAGGSGLSGPLGSIRVNNMGKSVVLDLSSATTLQDLRNRIEGAGLGVRVEINAQGTGIDILNEVSGGRDHAMSIEEVGGDTATRLGIRTLSGSTLISDFNEGRGVEVLDGRTDPVSGLLEPARDVEFTITLGDGRAFPVDLRPGDVITVASVIARINEQAADAGIDVPDDFEAGLTDGRNGIALRQNAAFAGALTVSAANASPAAEQLGLTGGAWDAGSATLTGEDRAKVRVENIFAHLIDLRDALRSDDTRGITLAGERLESSVSRLSKVRALVGGYAQRVVSGKDRNEDQRIMDERVRSELRDLDYTEAAVRFGMLQTQLTAALQATAQSSQRTLLDFLG